MMRAACCPAVDQLRLAPRLCAGSCADGSSPTPAAACPLPHLCASLLDPCVGLQHDPDARDQFPGAAHVALCQEGVSRNGN